MQVFHAEARGARRKDKYSLTMKDMKSMKIMHESVNERGATAYIH